MRNSPHTHAETRRAKGGAESSPSITRKESLAIQWIYPEAILEQSLSKELPKMLMNQKLQRNSGVHSHLSPTRFCESSSKLYWLQ